MPRQSSEARRQRIREAVAGLTAGSQRRYPAALRSQIVDYARHRLRAGACRSKISTELGVSPPTLDRVLAEAAPRTPRLRQVQVREPEQQVQRPALTVRGPGGIVIEGLSLDELTVLVRALS